MVGCAAPNCNNSSRHGIYKFHRFPADLERRQMWVKNCNRDNWYPTKNHFLCNVHFEETQFETKRIDGRRKLSPYAVPTIFNIPEMIDIHVKEEHPLSHLWIETNSNNNVAADADADTYEHEQEEFCPSPHDQPDSDPLASDHHDTYCKKLKSELKHLKMALQHKERIIVEERHKVRLLKNELDKKNLILKTLFSEAQIQKLLDDATL